MKEARTIKSDSLKKYPKLSVRIKPSLLEVLKNFAKFTENKPSTIIIWAIEEYIKNHKSRVHPALQNLIEI